MPSVSPRGQGCLGGPSCYLRLDRKVGLAGPRCARGKNHVGRSWRRCGAGVMDTLMTALGRRRFNRAGYTCDNVSGTLTISLYRGIFFLTVSE